MRGHTQTNICIHTVCLYNSPLSQQLLVQSLCGCVLLDVTVLLHVSRSAPHYRPRVFRYASAARGRRAGLCCCLPASSSSLQSRAMDDEDELEAGPENDRLNFWPQISLDVVLGEDERGEERPRQLQLEDRLGQKGHIVFGSRDGLDSFVWSPDPAESAYASSFSGFCGESVCDEWQRRSLFVCFYYVLSFVKMNTLKMCYTLKWAIFCFGTVTLISCLFTVPL